MINNLLLKIKYKLYVSILSTSIPFFIFASLFKFIVRGPNPGNSPAPNKCKYLDHGAVNNIGNKIDWPALSDDDDMAR